MGRRMDGIKIMKDNNHCNLNFFNETKSSIDFKINIFKRKFRGNA